MRYLLIILSFLFFNFLFPSEYLAILPFESFNDDSNINLNEIKTISEKFSVEMIKTNKYIIVERTRLDKIIKEQNLQHTGCVQTKCAVRLGQLLGAKYIIIGSIGKIGEIYSLNTRMISVETGEAYKSANYESKDIEDIYLNGTTSIAYQLNDFEYQSIPKVVIPQKKNFMNSIGLSLLVFRPGIGDNFQSAINQLENNYQVNPFDKPNSSFLLSFDTFEIHKYWALKLLFGWHNTSYYTNGNIGFEFYQSYIDLKQTKLGKLKDTGGKGLMGGVGIMMHNFYYGSNPLPTEDTIISFYLKTGGRFINKKQKFYIDMHIVTPLYEYLSQRVNGTYHKGQHLKIFEAERSIFITVGYLIDQNSIDKWNSLLISN